VRPTFDGQFRGQFDKALGPLGTANRMMEMHLAQMADMIYSEKIVRGNFDNPQDVGPGATLTTMDYQASIERAKTANSSPQLYSDIQLLLDQARNSAGVPQARHGDVDQNIASAQFVTAIQGKYITAVKNYQELIGDMEMRANAIALAVDEMYLDYPDKLLSSSMGGRSFKGTYTPSQAIAGRYENRVVFGAGAGLDRYNAKIAALQDVQNRLVSRRTVRSQLEYVQDTLLEESEIAREAMEDSFIVMLADPNFDPGLRLMALALASEGESMLTIAKQVFEAQQAAMAQQAAAAEAIAGAGLPGEMAGAPPEQIPQLPALASVAGGGA
jgi:hypothetical protein